MVARWQHGRVTETKSESAGVTVKMRAWHFAGAANHFLLSTLAIRFIFSCFVVVCSFAAVVVVGVRQLFEIF